MANRKSGTIAANKHEIMDLLRQGESLTLDFKSDLKCLPDRERWVICADSMITF
jgi:hypothetical protein